MYLQATFLEVELLGQMINVPLILTDIAKLSSKGLFQFTSSPPMNKYAHFPWSPLIQHSKSFLNLCQPANWKMLSYGIVWIWKTVFHCGLISIFLTISFAVNHICNLFCSFFQWVFFFLLICKYCLLWKLMLCYICCKNIYRVCCSTFEFSQLLNIFKM